MTALPFEEWVAEMRSRWLTIGDLIAGAKSSPVIELVWLVDPRSEENPNHRLQNPADFLASTLHLQFVPNKWRGRISQKSAPLEWGQRANDTVLRGKGFFWIDKLDGPREWLRRSCDAPGCDFCVDLQVALKFRRDGTPVWIDVNDLNERHLKLYRENTPVGWKGAPLMLIKHLEDPNIPSIKI